MLFLGRVPCVLIRALLEHMARAVKRNVIATTGPPVITLMGDVTVCQATPDLWWVMTTRKQAQSFH